MKQKIKIITVNILLILFCLAFAEFYLFSKEYLRQLNEENLRNISFNKPLNKFDLYDFCKFFKCVYLSILNTNITIYDFYFRPIPSYPEKFSTYHTHIIIYANFQFYY